MGVSCHLTLNRARSLQQGHFVVSHRIPDQLAGVVRQTVQDEISNAMKQHNSYIAERVVSRLQMNLSPMVHKHIAPPPSSLNLAPPPTLPPPVSVTAPCSNVDSLQGVRLDLYLLLSRGQFNSAVHQVRTPDSCQFLPIDEATASRSVVVLVSGSDGWAEKRFWIHLNNSKTVRDRPHVSLGS